MKRSSHGTTKLVFNQNFVVTFFDRRSVKGTPHAPLERVRTFLRLYRRGLIPEPGVFFSPVKKPWTLVNRPVLPWPGSRDLRKGKMMFEGPEKDPKWAKSGLRKGAGKYKLFELVYFTAPLRK